MNDGWYGFDLDGTLAEYHGFVAPDHIGVPIPAMVNKVKRLLASGKKVKIVTARANLDIYPFQFQPFLKALEAWCIEHIGCVLPITCSKDQHMIVLYDDRAIQVIPNSGKTLSELIAKFAIDIKSKPTQADTYNIANDLLRLLNNEN